MAKIPGVPNPSGISVGGNVNVGVPTVTAEDFGGGRARDLQNFGNSLQRAGGTVMDFGFRRERRKAEEDFLPAMQKLESIKADLSRVTGRAAENTLAELDRRTQEVLKESGGNLKSRWAREHFQELFDKQNYLNRKWAEGYAAEQGKAADANAFNGMQDKRLRDVEATPGFLSDKMKESEAGIREMYAGQDEEFLTAKVAVANAALAEMGVTSLGQSSPAEALKMLAKPEVEAALGKIKTGTMRERYQKLQIDSEQAAEIDNGIKQAIQTVDAGGSRADIYLQLVGKVGKETADKVMAGVDRWAGYAEGERKAAEKSAQEIDQARRKALEKEEEAQKEADEKSEKKKDESLKRFAGRAGRQLAQAGAMSMKVYEDAYANWDEKYAKILVDAYDAHIARKEKADNLAKTEQKAALIGRMLDADFQYEKLSPEEQQALLQDDDAYKAWTRSEKFRNENQNLKPDFEWWYGMQKQEREKPGAIAEWLNGPSVDPDGNMALMIKRLGGDKAMIKEMSELALEGAGGAAAGGKTGSGARRFTDADVNPIEFFNGNTLPGSIEPGEMDFRRNGFAGLFRSMLNDEEGILGRKATRKEQEKIARDLWREIEEGKITASSPYYKQVDQALALRNRAGNGDPVGRIDVNVEAMTFAEGLRYNRGEAVQNLSPVTGTPRQNFGVIPPDDTRKLPPEIIDTKAAEVLRAYEAGQIGAQDYAPDDFLVFDRAGTIRVFAPDGTQKGGRIREVLSPDMDAVRAAVEAEELKAIQAQAETGQDINQLRNSRAETARKLEEIRQGAGETPSLAMQRVIAQYEGDIRRIDEAIGTLRGENAFGEEAVIREERERQMLILTTRREELTQYQDDLRGRIQRGKDSELPINRRAAVKYEADLEKAEAELKDVEEKIKALEGEMK